MHRLRLPSIAASIISIHPTTTGTPRSTLDAGCRACATRCFSRPRRRSAVGAARDEGLVGGIGITGHGVGVAAVHLEALRRWPFDTVLTPYSYLLSRDPH